jgi:hypothetical protein
MGSLDWMIAGAICSIGIGLVGAWFRSEISVWYDPLIKALLRRAAKKMPEGLQVKTEAELLAWIEDTRSPALKLIQATHFLLNAAKSSRALDRLAEPDRFASAANISFVRPYERAAQVPVIRNAIDATIRLVNGRYPESVGSFGNLPAILTTNCCFLLLDGYKRARLDHRTSDYKMAAMIAAAIMTVRPVRFRRQIGIEEDLARFANWHCAFTASLSFLGIAPDKFNDEFIRRFYRAALGSVDLPCLSSYLQQFDNLVFLRKYPDDTSFEQVENTVPFAPFDNIDLSGKQLVQIEQLINVYQLLKAGTDTLRNEIK